MYNGAKICDGCMKCQITYPERGEEFGFSLLDNKKEEGDEEFGYQDECC